jgi:hypothetical protein
MSPSLESFAKSEETAGIAMSKILEEIKIIAKSGSNF